MYTRQQLKVAKIVVVVTWLFAVASFFFPLYYWSIGALGRALFWILLGAHVVEFPIFAKVYRASGEPMLSHLGRHLIFGVIHQTEVKQRGEHTT